MPELVEPLGQHVGDQEREDDRVEAQAVWRFPLEQIGLHVLDVVVGEPVPIDREGGAAASIAINRVACGAM